jgi:hypothetical protein
MTASMILDPVGLLASLLGILFISTEATIQNAGKVGIAGGLSYLGV